MRQARRRVYSTSSSAAAALWARPCASHPDVDLISFTGSTGAGARVGESAARTVKRVCLELGGKSANIVLTDGDLEKAARWNIGRGFSNAGQSCHAPSRLLVHESQVDDIIPFLQDEIDRMVVGDPRDPATTHGPLAHAQQFNSVQKHIEIGLDEGGRLVTGGLGRMEGFDRGFFCKPTVLAGVTPDMTLAKEEIFGPVLVVMPYQTEEEALDIANDSIFGLGGYVFSEDRKRGYEFSCGLRAGRISYNGGNVNSLPPWAGTSNPASAGRWACLAWRNIWRSNRSTASRRRHTPFPRTFTEPCAAWRPSRAQLGGLLAFRSDASSYCGAPSRSLSPLTLTTR